MKRRPFAKPFSVKAVLLVLLALQLVLGLQLQAAQAVTMPMPPAAMAMSPKATRTLPGALPMAQKAMLMRVAMSSMQMPVGSGMASSVPMPIPVAPADAAPGATAQPDCPTHSAHGTMHRVRASANLSGTREDTFERAPDHVPLSRHAPMGTHEGTHDCCQASACQCHCVYTPASIALPALANIATSVAIPSLASTRFVAPRIDEFLRPPIA